MCSISVALCPTLIDLIYIIQCNCIQTFFTGWEYLIKNYNITSNERVKNMRQIERGRSGYTQRRREREREGEREREQCK